MKGAESAMKSLTEDLLLLLSRKETGYVLSKSKSDNYLFLSESICQYPRWLSFLIPQVQFLKLLKKPELSKMQSKGTKENFNGECC